MDEDHEFCIKVAELRRRRPGLSREDAVDAVATAHPDLHFDFLMASNDDPAAKRLLAEKYGRDIDE